MLKALRDIHTEEERRADLYGKLQKKLGKLWKRPHLGPKDEKKVNFTLGGVNFTLKPQADDVKNGFLLTVETVNDSTSLPGVSERYFHGMGITNRGIYDLPAQQKEAKVSFFQTNSTLGMTASIDLFSLGAYKEEFWTEIEALEKFDFRLLSL